MSGKPMSFGASLSPLDWAISAASFVSIAIGVGFAPYTNPENWAYIAGPLFALASGLLFFVALRIQLQSHAQAIAEMVQNNENHAQLLLVARHEKEFTICLQAVQHAKQKLDAFSFKDLTGAAAITQVLLTWHFKVMYPDFDALDDDDHRPFSRMKNTDEVFPKFTDLDILNVYIYWTLHAVNQKDLAADDRRYLNSLITPMVMELGRSQHLIGDIIQQMKILLGANWETLQRLCIVPVVMEYHLNAMNRLFDRRVHKE